MKRKFIKKTVSVLLSVLLILTLTLGISAHEMFYTAVGSSYTVIELKWTNTLNGKAYLRMNPSGLNNVEPLGELDYVTQFNASYTAWNNCANLVIVEKVNSGGNVIYTCPSATTWSDLVGSTRIHDVLGKTVLRTSDGTNLMSYSAAAGSSKRVVYATIYMNPHLQYAYEFEGLDSLDMRSVLVHETGHALTLGHPNISYDPTSVASVMRSGETIYSAPQAHDIGDIRVKYG